MYENKRAHKKQLSSIWQTLNPSWQILFAKVAESVSKLVKKTHYRLLWDSTSQVSLADADFVIGRVVLIIAVIFKRK